MKIDLMRLVDELAGEMSPGAYLSLKAALKAETDPRCDTCDLCDDCLHLVYRGHECYMMVGYCEAWRRRTGETPANSGQKENGTGRTETK